jgi:uncharacterized protein (DUF2249 family)
MKEPGTIIDVRGMEKVLDRPKKVFHELDSIKKGDYADIIADDERMLELAPGMIKSIGKARFIKSWKGDDGYFHTLVEKE